MRLCLYIAGMVLFAVQSQAQLKNVEFFGYFEPQISVQYLNDDFLQIQRNKLRLDIASEISDRVSLKANYDFITYHGTTEINYLDFLRKPLVAGIPQNVRDQYMLIMTDEIFLDNAYLKIAFDRFDMTVGKQQISPGTGYAWNPTDMYNVKNIFDPTYENTGQSAYRVDIPFRGTFNLVILYFPDGNLDDSGKFLRLKGKAGHFDFSFAGGERQWTLTDFFTFEPIAQRRRLFGGDFAGELLGIGIWGEAAHNEMEITQDYFEGLIGTDYTFTSGLYTLTEYYHNEQGKSDYRQYNLNDWLRSFTAEIKAVCRDQLFNYFSYPATELLNVGNSTIACLNDGSLVLVPYLEYNLEENLDITFFGSFFLGTSGKAYSSDLGNGGILRMRYYF